MKYLRSIIIVIAVFAMMISLSGLAFAEIGKGACKGCKMDKDTCAVQIKTLRDSAAALQASNPTLAKGLNDLADKKAEKMQKMQEWKDKHAAKMNLLKDSATALKKSNPALAQELQKMSEKKYMEQGAAEKKEAEEAMEHAE
jgi:phage shock protein A